MLCRGPILLIALLTLLSNISSSRAFARGRGFALSLTTTVRQADCGGNGATITIHATGGTLPYEYSLDGVNYQSNNIFNVSVGTFQAYVRDAGGVTSSASVSISKHCLLVIADGTDPGCANTGGKITAVASNGIEPYAYSIDATNWQASPDFTGLVAGSYTVYVLDDAGQGSAGFVTLAVVCIQAVATPADATCGKNNGTISVAATGGRGAYHFSLDGVHFQDDPVFTGLAPGPYSITVKDDKGNTGTAGATVTALAAPGISTSPVAASCSNNDGSVLIIGLGGMPPYQYSLDGGGFLGSGAFDHLSTGDHQAAVKDANGCIAAQTVAITLINTLTVDGGPDLPICEGKAGTIRAISNGTSFSWSPAAGLDNASVLQPKASPGTSTTYYLTAHDGPCQKTAPVNVVVSPAPVAEAAAVAPICHGLSTQLQGSGGVRFSWTPSDYLNDPTAADPVVSKPAQSVTYRLTVTDGNGCQSLKPAEVTVTVTPPPRLFAGNDTSILAGQILPLYAADVDNSGLKNWRWSPAEWLDNAYVQHTQARPGESVTYTVTAATDAGCEATASIAVKVFSVSDIFVPNAFTPNGDGHNDVLKALPVGIKEFRYFAVFNRYGQRIFYTTNPSGAWRGDNNGEYHPAGTYVWMAGGVDYTGALVQRKGTVLLIR